MKVLMFAGSLRAGSLNKKYIRVAHGIVSGLPDVQSELIELSNFGLPVYDGDIESAQFPENAKTLAHKVTEAQAVVISSPENNGSIAAVLKNAVDWVSRVPGNPWKGKYILLLGASPGALGAIRGLWNMRVPFEALGGFVYPDMIGLARAHEAFDPNGALRDKAQFERLQELLKNFIHQAK
jgi:chromate reductase